MLQRILYNICNSLKNIVQKVKDIMGEYSKKLHIRKNGTIEDITLYTNSNVSNNTIKVRDGSTICYVPIGATDDSNASSLRVRKNGTTYAVMKSGYPTGSRQWSSSENSLITTNINLPQGTKKIQVKIITYSKGTSITKTHNVNGLSSINCSSYIKEAERRYGTYASVYVSIYNGTNKLFEDNTDMIDKLSGFNYTVIISWSPEINNG